VRTRNAQDFLAFLARTRAGALRHVRESVPAEVLDRIDHAARTDWIPVMEHGRFADAVLGVLGVDDMKSASREFLVQALVKSPAILRLFEGVQRVFGVTVAGFVRVIPSVVAQSYKDAFKVVVERVGSEALVVFEDIAPELLKFDAYPVVWEGVLLGIYDLASMAPQLDFKMQRGARRMEARFRW